MQIKNHLSAEQVRHLDVTIGRDWQGGRSRKDLLADELAFAPQPDQLYGRESVWKKPRKPLSALPKQRRDK